MNKQILFHKLRRLANDGLISARFVLLSILIGLTAGACSTLFTLSLSFSTIIREQNSWLIWLLPFGGLATVAIYHIFKDPDDVETNLVLSSVRSGGKVPFRVAPMMFVATVITHLLGGSAGGEGPALQIGGSIAEAFGTLFRFEEKDKKILMLCGMSAGLSVLLGAPMGSAFLALEIVSIGILEYTALLPCIISSLIANATAGLFGVYTESFSLTSIPAFRVKTAAAVCILAILCSLLSIFFSFILHGTERLYKTYVKNHYLRAFLGGCLVLGMTLLIRSQLCSGSGIDIVRQSLKGETAPLTFLLKIAITALTIGAGFKGGEIIPSMAIGASFGCLYGQIIGFNPGFCAAIGMLALFCGVTSCPIATLLIGFEFFGYQAMPFFLLTIAFSNFLTGYYNQQRTYYTQYKRYKENYLLKLHLEYEKNTGDSEDEND